MNSICEPSGSGAYRTRDLGQNRLQVQLLSAISESDTMADVVFHGGSSLLLCYDGVRLSEDLDFSSPRALTAAQYDDVAMNAIERLATIYDAPATVTPLKRRNTDSGLTISRFHVRCEAVGSRPDIPKLDVKLEFATVPSYTRVTRTISPLFSEPIRLPFLTTAALEEQLANKAIAVTASPYLRYRDLWDTFFLTSTGQYDLEATRSLFKSKMEDYGVSAAEVQDGLIRIRQRMMSDEGIAEWQQSIGPRLIDPDWSRQIQDPAIAEAVTSEALRVIESICGGQRQVQFRRRH